MLRGAKIEMNLENDKYSIALYHDDDGWYKLALNGDEVLQEDEVLFLTFGMINLLTQMDESHIKIIQEFAGLTAVQREEEMKYLYLELLEGEK